MQEEVFDMIDREADGSDSLEVPSATKGLEAKYLGLKFSCRVSCSFTPSQEVLVPVLAVIFLSE